jgi:hypothetical protein|tara:strand:- start:37 stop:156 length:120 start_codon:yes stop_codon:yes gene_type:complete
VSAGYGSMADGIKLLKDKGRDYINQLLRVKVIQQEEADG